MDDSNLNEVISNEIKEFILHNDGSFTIISKTSKTKDNLTVSAEDAVRFDPKLYVKIKMIEAIINGIPTNDGSVIALSQDEYSVEVTPDGDVKVSITPRKDSPAELAFVKYLFVVLNDINTSSRAASTTAIRRAGGKVAVSTVQSEAVTEIEKVEMAAALEKAKIKLFNIARDKGIPLNVLQEKSIELTGKKTSSKWTKEDVDKMMAYVETYK